MLARVAGHPFASHAWIDAWLSAFAADTPLAVYTAWEGDRLAAAIPLVRRGAMLAAAANAHTPWFSPLGEPEPLGRVAEAVAASAASHVVLPELALGEEATTVLTEALRRERSVVWVDASRSAPVIDRESLPAEYAAHLSRDRRREVRRLGRRLEELGATVAPLERPTDVDADVERALTLEASGWKGRRGTAILNDPATARFYRDVARAFAKRDELRLSTVSLDGRAGRVRPLHRRERPALDPEGRHRRAAPPPVARHRAPRRGDRGRARRRRERRRAAGRRGRLQAAVRHPDATPRCRARRPPPAGAGDACRVPAGASTAPPPGRTSAADADEPERPPTRARPRRADAPGAGGVQGARPGRGRGRRRVGRR